MSSLSKLEKLMYSIGVVDKVTGPVNKIMGKIGALKQQSQQAMQQMTTGAMGAVAGVVALTGSLNPAIDQVVALGEVQSLGVANDALVQLTAELRHHLGCVWNCCPCALCIYIMIFVCTSSSFPSRLFHSMTLSTCAHSMLAS